MLRRPLLVLVVFVAACGARTDPSSAGSPGSMAAGAGEVRHSTIERVAAGETLVVGGKEGILEIDLDGAVVATLARGDASNPRWLPGGESLVYWSPARRQLRRLDVTTGQERVLHRLLAPEECGEQPLDIQDRGAGLLVRGSIACAELLDRNWNMANVLVRVVVDLERGVSREHPVIVPDGCPMDEQEHDDAWCTGERRTDSSEAGPTGDAEGGPYTVSSGHLRRLAPHPGMPAAGTAASDELVSPVFPGIDPPFESHDPSPSGRWQIAAGNEAEGDYIYQQYLLLDTHTGDLYPIDPGAERWPAVIDRARLDDREEAAALPFAATEDSPFWLGRRDLLLCGRALYQPARRLVIRLPGDPAL